MGIENEYIGCNYNVYLDSRITFDLFNVSCWCRYPLES